MVKILIVKVNFFFKIQQMRFDLNFLTKVVNDKIRLIAVKICSINETHWISLKFSLIRNLLTDGRDGSGYNGIK